MQRVNQAEAESLTESEPLEKQSFLQSAPTITLPKGGGAIRGIGEKFAANPVTGTGSMTVPIATSPGRSGFGPQLSISYDSGAGNGPFGLGWNLSLPSITRKTDKGLPRYDELEESDVFILSGAEDLVPVAGSNAVEKIRLAGKDYTVRRYRPRIEGLFAHIERWTEIGQIENTFWRSISRDNITTWYGRDGDSRIFDPSNPQHIFQWLICQTNDDKGNVSIYSYVADNSYGVDTTAVWESNRQPESRATNRYVKRILYGNVNNNVNGNVKPYLPKLSIEQDDPLPQQWMFEVVFDYGDHDDATPQTMPAKTTVENPWPARKDAFSNHRAGFEIRTYRLCRRVLMFHRFKEELGVPDYLVRSTNFLYAEPEESLNPDNPGYTVLKSVTHYAYQKRTPEATAYESRQLPPVSFSYSKPRIDPTIHHIEAAQLENLPVGTQGPGYRWIDLDGEGLTGVLAEQGSGWYYKPNLGDGTLGPLRQVVLQPAMVMSSGSRFQFMDLAGDGSIDVVDFSGPTPGIHERDQDEGWKRHVPFASLPNIDWQDPNLRFVDLTGDGLADALITEHEVFTWYPSLGEQGFAPSERTRQAKDEDKGPRAIFADGTETIFLADMCGDGLTDLVRIRNGEVCYWPNLGYGRFGRKITLANSPRFDHPDLFDPNRIRLTDIDGSGPIDVIYLGSDGARLYFNRSGNSLSDPVTVDLPLATENLNAVQVADLLGNGTACLVWNSHLPADTHRPVYFIDLMAGLRQTDADKLEHRKHEKPHLLIQIDNNLGATTEIEYTPSTRFYLQDQKTGNPWITRLPFPVHCVSKVTVRDKWRGATFSSTYSYHHGYFDGHEREFRGFGRVEQVDVEQYDTFSKNNATSLSITPDKTLYQPPIKTITWYHTGADLDRARILNQFEQEYFPKRYVARLSKQSTAFYERPLPEPVLAADLTGEEWREAMRACKGMMLRQEIYELDVSDWTATTPKHTPVRLYYAATHNCRIQRLQAKEDKDRHAVFFVTESEAISYHYELAIPKDDSPLKPDPRIAHTINLRHDEYGNPQQTVAIAYPRWQAGDLGNVPQPELITAVQKEEHIAYTEIRYTRDVKLPKRQPSSSQPLAAIRHHRLTSPCEMMTYELTGIAKIDAPYYAPDDFAQVVLSEAYGPLPGAPENPQNVPQREYHTIVPKSELAKRIVEHTRTFFFDDENDDAPPDHSLAFGLHGPRGLKYEDYKLALTDQLLTRVFGDKLDWATSPGITAQSLLTNPVKSGYIPGSQINSTLQHQYWIRSGTAGFAPDAHQHFFLPERYIDPFDNVTTLAYDNRYDLFMQSSTDALNNTTRIEQFDYRVLAPRSMIDINGNHTEVIFDVLGLPVALAIKGKQNNDQWEGDDLNGFDDFDLSNPSPQLIQQFCTVPLMQEDRARKWLGRATARFVYHFGSDANGQWNQHRASACSIAREQHKDEASPLQVSLECSDGSGNVLMKKVQAEPAPGQTGLRWIINGLTVLNNKGKPVKQYEPSFSEQGFGCEPPPAEGVSSTLYYDAAGRVVRTEMPDGSYSRVEFSPWHVKTFDANDTAYDPHQPDTSNPNHSDWFRRRTDPAHPRFDQFKTAEHRRAAELVKAHANTPAETYLDSLGREVIALAHNRINGEDTKYLTYTKLDAEGKPLWIRDARGSLVMQYITPPKANNDPDETIPNDSVPCYDIAGNLLFQHSMDAGDRWMLMDAAGKPMLAWDEYRPRDAESVVQKRLYTTDYDKLHRLTAQWLTIDNRPRVRFERFEYQDAAIPDPRNLNGQITKHYDPSGLFETVRRDFKGNVEEAKRTLNNKPKASLIDWQNETAENLGKETFVQITQYDALNRMTKLFNWHRGVDSRVAVYEPAYGARGLLSAEKLIVGAKRIDVSGQTSYTDGQETNAIAEIRYDAKGQRQYLRLGNGVITTYTYDPETFRLIHLNSKRSISEPCTNAASSMFEDDRIVQDLHYWYDPVGNITEIADPALKIVYFGDEEVKPVNRYEYDALYRLISATGREHGAASGMPSNIEGAPLIVHFPCIAANAFRNYIQHYHYDPVGNIQQMRHVAGSTGSWTRDYTYAFDDASQPASNRLWRTSTGNGTQAVTYTYDSHGSMLNLNNVADEFLMQWDHRDMIATINLGGGGFAHYQYDANKQRTRKYIEKNNGNIVEERFYLGGLELYRRIEAGVVKEEIETLHLFDGEQRLLMVDHILETDNSELGKRILYRYTLSNHLGSSTLELDHAAKLISHEEYHPYGTSAYRAGRNAAEAKLKRYRYTGMERDEESGLNYHGARYYLPWLGRWGSVDPIGIQSSNNFYMYASNVPILLADLNGLQAKKPPPQIMLFEQFTIDTLATNSGYSQEKSIVRYVKNTAYSWGEDPSLYHAGHHPETPQWSTPPGGQQKIGPQNWIQNLIQSMQESRDRAKAVSLGQYARSGRAHTGAPVPNPTPVVLPLDIVTQATQKPPPLPTPTSGRSITFTMTIRGTPPGEQVQLDLNLGGTTYSVKPRVSLPASNITFDFENGLAPVRQVPFKPVQIEMNLASEFSTPSSLTSKISRVPGVAILGNTLFIYQMTENSPHAYNYNTELAELEYRFGLRDKKPQHIKDREEFEAQEQIKSAEAKAQAEALAEQNYLSERERGLSGARGGPGH